VKFSSFTLHYIESFELFRTVSEPDIPILLESCIQQTSADLDWELGNTEVINSSIVFYTDISSMSSTESTDTINQLTGLTPGRTYRFYLEVTSFDKTARSTTHTVTTREFSISPSIF